MSGRAFGVSGCANGSAKEVSDPDPSFECPEPSPVSPEPDPDTSSSSFSTLWLFCSGLTGSSYNFGVSGALLTYSRCIDG